MDKSTQALMPIETAPKDGTEVICYDGNLYAITCWQKVAVYAPQHRKKVRYVECFAYPEGFHNASEWYPKWWSPLPVMDATDYPECSGDPLSCPENEGYGCCKPNPPDESMR